MMLATSAMFASLGLFDGHHRASCTYRANRTLPDAACTPGVLNPDVTQRTIDATICRPGWTKSIRPPVSWTAPRKLAAMRAYGAHGSPSGYEYDHLVSLELGGAPADTRNLWPEPHATSFVKDAVENRLRRAVCAGTMSLRHAQHVIRTDWRQG